MNRSKIWSKEFETATKTTWYNWNPVRGCLKYKNGCPVPDCWAAVACSRWAEQWAEYEQYWINNFDGPWFVDKKTLVEKLKNFKPTWFDSQYKKLFPIEKCFILTCWQSELSTVPGEWVQKIIDRILSDNSERENEGLPLHQFFFLTKWPEFYQKFNWPANCWLGATMVNDKAMEKKLPHILEAGKQNKTFIMFEPLESEISHVYLKEMANGMYEMEPVIKNGTEIIEYKEGVPVSWVVVGGGSTPLNPDWVRPIRDKCKAAEILFHFKGWGRRYPYWCPNEKIYKFEKSKKRIGQVIDGELHLGGPEKK